MYYYSNPDGKSRFIQWPRNAMKRSALFPVLQANFDLREENENLANEVVNLHARLRAYEDTAGELTRAHRLEALLEEAIDTLQWLAAGEEVVYAHDVDVVARGLVARLEELNDGA